MYAWYVRMCVCMHVCICACVYMYVPLYILAYKDLRKFITTAVYTCLPRMNAGRKTQDIWVVLLREGALTPLVKLHVPVGKKSEFDYFDLMQTAKVTLHQELKDVGITSMQTFTDITCSTPCDPSDAVLGSTSKAPLCIRINTAGLIICFCCVLLLVCICMYC
jgi:hypothetical protein